MLYTLIQNSKHQKYATLLVVIQINSRYVEVGTTLKAEYT